MRHIFLIANLILWSAVAHAADGQGSATANHAGTVKANEESGDTIVHRESFAAYMGLTDKDAEFSLPRNFRTSTLNEVQPLDDN